MSDSGAKDFSTKEARRISGTARSAMRDWPGCKAVPSSMKSPGITMKRLLTIERRPKLTNRAALLWIRFSILV